MIISTACEGADLHEGDLNAQDVEVRTLEVGIEGNGYRLDKWLASEVTGFSRSYLQQLVEAGAARVNGAVVTKVAHKVRIGDAVTIELRPTEQSKAFIPQVMALDVVYEDSDVLVINKPPGLVVHPAPGNWTGTLLNGLLERAACFSEVPRAGIVHRLDKDTSGLMVVAKTRFAMDALVAAIAARQVNRMYLALAKGPWTGRERTRSVEAAIGRDPGNRLRMAVVDLRLHSGKTARTDVTCLDESASAMLVLCKLHTGRTHQIRVHMASLGWPLLSDTTYGGPAGQVIRRQALHAVCLAFEHPRSGIPLEFSAPIPEDFATEMQLAGLRYNGKTLS